MPVKGILLYGAGDMGRELLWLIEEINQVIPTWEVMGFLDDGLSRGSEVSGCPVLDRQWLNAQQREIAVVCSVSEPRAKKKIISQLSMFGNVSFPALIHPKAIFPPDFTPREGCVFYPHTVISVSASIGSHVTLNSCCTIGHDTVIGDFSTVSPGANIAGHVVLGECVFVGLGCSIIPEKSVGSNTILGAGSVVTRDVSANCVAYGVPCKPRRFFIDKEG